MKTVLLVLCLAAVSCARPQLPVAISLQRTQFLDDAGQFSLSYHNSDGHSVEDIGVLKPNKEGTDHILARQGSYRYISPEGIPISISYVADEYGFRPVGNVVPGVSAAAVPVI